ncbi:MAG: 3-deoxy-D-manno-octulosonic acid transferase [Acidobacteriota bacterium]|nr:3-deoxy-D-manno-octulosonic acid transferase [Acidobacteriota bacterium]
MYFLYSLLLTLGIGLLLPLFLLDALRHGKYLAGLRERLGDLPQLQTGGRPVIWLHCVSVGETQAARPLAQALLARYPTHALIISTTTLTGQQLARELFRAEAAAIVFFPFDWAWTVRRALKAVQPSIVLIMETELWPRFLRECRARQIPVAIVNGRISEKSFRGYQRLGSFIRRAVDDITLALMQTESDAARLQALGLAAGRIRVAGNVKFDIKTEAEDQELTRALCERFAFDNQRPLIIAASTHAPEEAICIAAYEQLLATSDARPRLLIAPRHPERFAEVTALLETSGRCWARRSANLNEQDRMVDVVLLDSIGELRAVYPLAEIVFVGGSIARTGGHNVLEPAAAAKCIVTGAHTFNFTAVMRDFLERGALVQLPHINETEASTLLARTFNQLLKDDARRLFLGRRARATLDENRGATARTVELLAPLFSERSEVRDQRSVNELITSDL